MPKGPKGEKRPGDVIGAAIKVAKIATGEIEDVVEKKPGTHEAGKSGGRARADSLTPEERSEIARVAAQARWKKGT
jgi:hypothetical protein